jgi:hypothetical protein
VLTLNKTPVDSRELHLYLSLDGGIGWDDSARVEYVRVRHLPAREHTHAAGLYPPANVPAGKKNHTRARTRRVSAGIGFSRARKKTGAGSAAGGWGDGGWRAAGG